MARSNFEKEIKICLLLFQILGLQPFSIHGISDGSNSDGSVRSWTVIFNFILIVLLEIAFLILHNTLGMWTIYHRTDIEILLQLARRCLYFVEGFTCLSLAFVNAKSYYRLLHDFYQIARKFSTKFDFAIDYSRFRRNFMLKVLYFCCMLFIIHSFLVHLRKI